MTNWQDAIMPDDFLDDLVEERAQSDSEYPATKPGKGTIFRVHPTLHGKVALWKHELDTDNDETYLVMCQEVARTHASRVIPYTGYLWTSHDGRYGVWLVNNLRGNSYGRTGHAVAKAAMTEWITTHADTSKKRYRAHRVTPKQLLEMDLGEPKWPDLEHIAQALVPAFEEDELVIGSMSHPLVRSIGSEVKIDLSDIE